MSTLERIATLIKLWKEIAVTKARVYHAHNIHVGPAAWLASQIHGGALVYDAHELYGEPMPDSRARGRAVAWLAGRLEGLLVRHSSAVITTNPSRAEVLRSMYGRHDVFYLANVPNIVDPLRPDSKSLPSGFPILLYQGGIYAEGRAFRETIHALADLPDVCFVVVGFGREADLELLRGWAREAGVGDRVMLLPPRPFDELVNLAAAASVGLVPIKALRTNERLGDTNKLHEYLMAGLPVVGSDLPEIARVIRSGQPPVGEVFDPTSPSSIARAVTRVLSDPEYPARRSEARRLALELHNWQREEPKLLGLYRALIRGKSSPESDGATVDGSP